MYFANPFQKKKKKYKVYLLMLFVLKSQINCQEINSRKAKRKKVGQKHPEKQCLRYFRKKTPKSAL